jgi:hypothetical protein
MQWTLLEFEREVTKDHDIETIPTKTTPENEVEQSIRKEINDALTILSETKKISSLLIQYLIIFNEKIMNRIAFDVHNYIKGYFNHPTHNGNYFLMQFFYPSLLKNDNLIN